MNPNTGAIAQFETLADAEQAGFTEPLTPKQAAKLAGVSRTDRLAWLKKRRKSKAKRQAQAKARRKNRH